MSNSSAHEVLVKFAACKDLGNREREHPFRGRTTSSKRRGRKRVWTDDEREAEMEKQSEEFKSEEESKGNTGTYVDGSFHPQHRVGGSYGYTTMPEEAPLMRTPALPTGEYDEMSTPGNIKVSGAVAAEIREKLARCKKDKDISKKLNHMQKSNSDFYAHIRKKKHNETKDS